MTDDFTPPTYSTWQLANLADCGSPDRPDFEGLTPTPSGTADPSAGAKFLRHVADAFVEAWGDLGADPDGAGEWDDRLSEIADGAPDVYTHTMWTEFVDLAAHQEDPTDLGCDGSDMDAAARICLYMIAERLARKLHEEATEAHEAWTDEQEGDDQ